MSSELPIVRAGDPSPKTLRYLRSAGHACLVGMLVTFVVLYKYRGEPYDETWHLVLAQFLSGRAGSAGLGLTRGFSPYYLLFHISMHDFIIMLYVYPLFVSGYQHLSRVPMIGPTLFNLHRLALQHKTRIAPYGAIGLMLFVLFPFWSTGPLVGVVLGYLIGLRPWVTFSSVIVGNVAAVAAWIWFYDRLNSYSPKFALILLTAIFAAAMGGTFYARFRRKRREQLARAEEASAETSDDPSGAKPDEDAEIPAADASQADSPAAESSESALDADATLP